MTTKDNKDFPKQLAQSAVKRLAETIQDLETLDDIGLAFYLSKALVQSLILVFGESRHASDLKPFEYITHGPKLVGALEEFMDLLREAKEKDEPKKENDEPPAKKSKSDT